MAKKIHDPNVTKNVIKEALILLLEKKPYDTISVAELSRVAHINRVTFYSHYDNIVDLMTEVETELADQILETQSHLFKSENFHEDVTNMLLDIFLSNQQIGVWFLSNHTTGAGEKRIHDFSKEICINEWRNHKTMSELQLNLFYEYYYAGAMAFLKTWYHSGLLEDVESIRKEFIEITGLTIQYIFG